MANAKKGEVGVKFRGKSLKLVLDFNAICELEDMLGRDIVTIARELEAGEKSGKVSFRIMRAILWASMQKSMPDAGIRDAGDLAQTLGTDFGAVIGDLFSRSGLFSNDAPEKSGGNVKSS